LRFIFKGHYSLLREYSEENTMADNDQGPGGKHVQTGYIIFFGVLLIAATGALLYGIYAACPVCEPPESTAGAASAAAADTPQPAPSQSPGVTASPTPVAELRLIAVSPDSGPVTGGNLVRLDGIGLNNVKEVRFGGQPATPVGSPNPTSLMVKPPAHVEGQVDVVVSDGQSRDTRANPAFYTYLGSGFAQEVRVTFDDLPAKVAKVEDQAITVTTPPHAPGKVKVVVIQGGASHEAPGGFTYKNAGPPPEKKPEDNDG
jgi:hypothetical protein